MLSGTEVGDVLVVPGVAVRNRRAVSDPRNLRRSNNVLARLGGPPTF